MAVTQPHSSAPSLSPLHPSTTMVALKRKRPGQDYGEDEKLLHQVQGSTVRSNRELSSLSLRLLPQFLKYLARVGKEVPGQGPPKRACSLPLLVRKCFASTAIVAASVRACSFIRIMAFGQRHLVIMRDLQCRRYLEAVYCSMCPRWREKALISACVTSDMRFIFAR